MSAAPVQMPLDVVVGGSTRLARALVGGCLDKSHELWMAARDKGEAEAFSALYPSARILPMWEDKPFPRFSGAEARIYCCAFGTVHPSQIGFERELDVMRRDMRCLEQILAALRHAHVHVVIVSSVLALRPRSGRAYYAGWKNIAAELAANAAGALERANVSVILPGRLTEFRTARNPLTYLYSTYAELASVIKRASDATSSSRRIVGLDARLWLALQACLLIFKAAAGRD